MATYISFMIKKTGKSSDISSASAEKTSKKEGSKAKVTQKVRGGAHHHDSDNDSLQMFKSTSSRSASGASQHDSESDSPSVYESVSSGSIRGKLNQRKVEASTASGLEKKSLFPRKTYPARSKAKLGQLNSSSGFVGKLREESLQVGEPESVTPEQRNDDLRRSRSVASSQKRQREDPTLMLPPKNYVSAKKEEKNKGVYAQRPGPETRQNQINIAAEARAMQKHGTYRKLRLSPDDFQFLKKRLVAKLGVTDKVAADLIQNTMWSGGYSSPGRTEEGRVEDAKRHRLMILWDPRTVVKFIQKGLRGFGHRLFNLEGRMIEHSAPSGRGLRTSDLAVEHVHLSASHSGHDVNLGPDIQTHLGVTNPAYFTKAAFEAEEARYEADLKANPKTPKPMVLVLMEKYDMKSKL